jgi:hypothetical protein
MLTPEIIELYRNWCCTWRDDVTKCFYSSKYSKKDSAKVIWIILQSGTRHAFEINNSASSLEGEHIVTQTRIIAEPGDIIIFNEKSLNHINSLEISGNTFYV